MKMIIQFILLAGIGIFAITSCKTITPEKKSDLEIPQSFLVSLDSGLNTGMISWQEYFQDPHLILLIDHALQNNQELNILLQEIEIHKNEIRARKGEYLPNVGIGAGAGLEKEGRYTRFGALENQLEVMPNKRFPEPYSDYFTGLVASWEIDIWKKLRNSRKVAFSRYLQSYESRNFMITNLVAEIAESYYELVVLDSFREMILENIDIQKRAVFVIQQQKIAAKSTQLAVNRFEAQLLNTQNLLLGIDQRIIETENHLNYLVGRFPQPIKRGSLDFEALNDHSFSLGLPSHLLANRPDIKKAELELIAAKLDVKVARANFYPSVAIKSGVGFNAFNPTFFFSPESIMFRFAGDLVAPLINRNAIKAAYNTASALQIQSVYQYEQTILQAYVDVMNQMTKLTTYSKSFETKKKEVDLLVNSIRISEELFNSVRADYGEVLLTQREAVDAKKELVEIKMNQLTARVNIYRALGGGWR